MRKIRVTGITINIGFIGLNISRGSSKANMPFSKLLIWKNMLNQIVEQIVVKNEKELTVFFKSGLIMDRDFMKTIK